MQSFHRYKSVGEYFDSVTQNLKGLLRVRVQAKDRESIYIM